MSRTLIVGAGYLARFLVPRLRARGVDVVATTRSENRRSVLENLGAEVRHLELEALDESELLEEPFDHVVYSAAAGRGGDRRLVFCDAPVDVLTRINHEHLKRFVFTSSIGVYHRDDGEWVDEDSSPRTSDPKAELLEGEINLLTVNAPITVLRLAGLYGPGRSPIEWMGDETRRARIARVHPDGFVNWIHIEDAAHAIDRVLQADSASPLYNVVDNEPAKRREFYALACELGGHPPLELSGISGLGKRVRNNKLRADFQWQPRYPTYRDGLLALTEVTPTA